jgi:hypothetical protein
MLRSFAQPADLVHQRHTRRERAGAEVSAGRVLAGHPEPDRGNYPSTAPY